MGLFCCAGVVWLAVVKKTKNGTSRGTSDGGYVVVLLWCDLCVLEGLLSFFLFFFSFFFFLFPLALVFGAFALVVCVWEHGLHVCLLFCWKREKKKSLFFANILPSECC
jgi:hypothetical protein